MVRKLSLVLLPLAAALLGGPPRLDQADGVRIPPATRHVDRPAEDRSGRPSKPSGLARATIEAKAPVKRHGDLRDHGLPAATGKSRIAARLVRSRAELVAPTLPLTGAALPYFPTGPPERV